ncbi:hypothetical protein LIER_37030 [Lithospermum erythrorhizon]|uniref:Reverse transcriptase/retrotransposon-derived protein RNase H-like domain-containing protein n=1 Tax=Lithospermum erythrorhizon TaxID=34254 RepID=A0AAV3PI02_LITER
MEPLSSYKEVQKLTGCLAILNCFISKSRERNLPFFKNLRGMSKEKFTWDEESNKAFTELKEYLGSPQLLSRPESGKSLQLYLAISDVAVSSVLIKEVEGAQKSIYYVSHVLRGAEEMYPIIDKASFALVISTRKLKSYFESHLIQVVTDQPRNTVLTSSALIGRLTTWAIELGEFEISYSPWTSIKAQALADFVIECMARAHPIIQAQPKEEETNSANFEWSMHIDGPEMTKERVQYY